MTYTFRKAVRENSSVLIALAGHTGTGKTKSALRLARGLAGPKGRIVMLDTESGRGTHYSDQHDYDYAEIKPPFSPMAYREAIEAADQAGYDVVIADSMSHEWAGDGGCCDMQAEALERMAQGDARRMERLTAPAWKDAKIAHKRMMSRLLQARASIICCLRAEPKIRFTKIRGDDGRDRTAIEDMGFQPICEKSFMFEMTVSFMINAQHLPEPIKLGEQFQSMFPLDRPLSEDSGRQLAAWAAGGAPAGATPVAQLPSPEPARPTDTTEEPGPDPPTYRPEDAIGMLARMAGGRMGAKEIERAFAPGVRNTTAAQLLLKRDPDKFRVAFDRIYRDYLAWKDTQ